MRLWILVLVLVAGDLALVVLWLSQRRKYRRLLSSLRRRAAATEEKLNAIHRTDRAFREGRANRLR